MSEHRLGAAGSPAAALRPVTGAAQAARVAWRWTMAYTQPPGAPCDAPAAACRSMGSGRWAGARRALAVAARPGLWLANLLFVAFHGPEVVAAGVAAACVPNPARAERARRVLWPVIGGLVAAFLAAAILLLGGMATAVATGRDPAAVGLAVLIAAGIGALPLTVAHLVWDRRGAVSDRLLHRCAAELGRAADRPVVVGTWFGAWPRGTGEGTALLTAVLAELRADRVGLLVAARDDRVAAWYTAHGGLQVDVDRPHVLAWPP